MGINGFSQSPFMSVLLAPLQAIVALFMPAHSACSYAPPRLDRAVQRRSAPVRAVALATSHIPVARVALTPFQTTATTTSSRLKVVREFDQAVAPSCAGRMVISGRMADVCAELDRMAQREAAH